MVTTQEALLDAAQHGDFYRLNAYMQRARNQGIVIEMSVMKKEIRCCILLQRRGTDKQLLYW